MRSAHQLQPDERAQLVELGARGVDELALGHAVHDVQCALEARAELLLERSPRTSELRLRVERSRLAAHARASGRLSARQSSESESTIGAGAGAAVGYRVARVSSAVARTHAQLRECKEYQ